MLGNKLSDSEVENLHTRLGKTARAILELFDDKPEWGTDEIAKTLGLNINTAAKTIKMLVKDGYLVKHGTTRGAWYKRR